MGIFKKIGVALAFTAFSTGIFAQGSLSYWEFGPFIGTLSSSSEIATDPIPNIIKETRPQIGVQAEYFFGPIIGIGGNVNLGWVYAADKNHTNVSRGLEIRSSLATAELHMTLNLWSYGRFRRATHWVPYVTVGGGVAAVQTYNYGSENTPRNTTFTEGTTVNGILNFGFGTKFKLSLTQGLAVELNGSIMPSDRLEGFQYNGVDNAPDIYGGVRIRYSFMSILKRGTY